MMNINDNNYELWLLRYAEQELSSAERAEVERWLATHPEAAEELALYNEAPRLERDETVQYVAVPRQHTQLLWKTAWRWAAAAAVVLALMIPGLRGTSPAPQLALAGNTPEMPEVPETPEAPGKPKTTRPSVPKTISLPPTPREEPSTLAALDNPEQLETLDSPEELEQLETPATSAPQYVDNLIVFESEPDTESVAIEEYATAEVVYTRTESGVNPIGLFISTFIKVNK